MLCIDAPTSTALVAMQPVRNVKVEAGRTVELRLETEQGYVLHGQVCDAAKKTPINGMCVIELYKDGTFLDNAFPTNSGRFRFRATIPAGSYKLKVAPTHRFKNRYLPIEIEVRIPEQLGTNDEGIVIELAPKLTPAPGEGNSK
jgi:hypothetical protein